MAGSLPLSGLVVVELGTSVAAPTAAQIFAELGAEVFKIENPAGGDDARSWGPPFVDGVAAMFAAINRNKRSVAIDLKDVLIVDREAIKLLAMHESNGVELRNCPASIRDWVPSERAATTTPATMPFTVNLASMSSTGIPKCEAGKAPPPKRVQVPPTRPF